MRSRRLFDGAQIELGLVPVKPATGAAGGGGISGTAAGGLLLTGSAAGVVLIHATASGEFSLTGSADGAAGTNLIQGAASGALSLTGSADGAVLIHAAASGEFSLTGGATGAATIRANAAGDLPLTGSASGEVASAGSGASAAQIWNYQLLPGVTAGQMLTEIWQSLGSRTAEQIAAAVLAAAEADPIHADARKMNGTTIQGTGIASDLWRGVP
jgi:hypothetical protein